MPGIFPEIIRLFEHQPVFQTLWILAFITELLVVSVRNDRKMVLFDTVASFLWILHFATIGAWTASGNNFISIFRNAASLRWKGNLKIAIGFCISYLVLLYFTYVNAFSVLPIISSFGYTLWFFLFSGVSMRIFPIVGSICWLIYAIYTASVGWVLAEWLMIGTAMLTLLRMRNPR